MKCVIIFSILTISTIAHSIKNEDARALQIAKNLEEDIAKNIMEQNADKIAAHFIEHFEHHQCDETKLNRAAVVAKLLERKTKTSIPEPIYVFAMMFNNEQMSYMLDERFKSGDVLSTRVMVHNINGTWTVVSGQDIKCK